MSLTNLYLQQNTGKVNKAKVNLARKRIGENLHQRLRRKTLTNWECSWLGLNVGSIDTTSTFYVITFTDRYLRMICTTFRGLARIQSFSESLWRQYHIRTQIPVQTLHSEIWDTEPVNSDSCGISPNERFILRSQPESEICFLREMKKLLNTTDSIKNGFRSRRYKTKFYPVIKSNNERYFAKHSNKRWVLSPYVRYGRILLSIWSFDSCIRI